MFSSSAPDVSLFGDMLNKFAEGGPGRITKNLKEAIRSGQETRQSAASTLRNYASVRGWDPDTVERKIGKIQRMQPTSIASTQYESFTPTIQSTYRDLLGRDATPEEIQQRLSEAGAQRINPDDPGAFSAFLGDVISSSPEGMGKIKTQADLDFEAKFGPMARTPEGYLQRGLVKFRPEVVGGALNSMFSGAYPGLFDSILKSKAGSTTA